MNYALIAELVKYPTVQSTITRLESDPGVVISYPRPAAVSPRSCHPSGRGSHLAPLFDRLVINSLEFYA